MSGSDPALRRAVKCSKGFSFPFGSQRLLYFKHNSTTNSSPTEYLPSWAGGFCPAEQVWGQREARADPPDRDLRLSSAELPLQSVYPEQMEGAVRGRDKTQLNSTTTAAGKEKAASIERCWHKQKQLSSFFDFIFFSPCVLHNKAVDPLLSWANLWGSFSFSFSCSCLSRGLFEPIQMGLVMTQWLSQQSWLQEPIGLACCLAVPVIDSIEGGSLALPRRDADLFTIPGLDICL